MIESELSVKWLKERAAQAAGLMVEAKFLDNDNWMGGRWKFDSNIMEYRIKPGQVSYNGGSHKWYEPDACFAHNHLMDKATDAQDRRYITQADTWEPINSGAVFSVKAGTPLSLAVLDEMIQRVDRANELWNLGYPDPSAQRDADHKPVPVAARTPFDPFKDEGFEVSYCESLKNGYAVTPLKKNDKVEQSKLHPLQRG